MNNRPQQGAADDKKIEAAHQKIIRQRDKLDHLAASDPHQAEEQLILNTMRQNASMLRISKALNGEE